jgi:iron complex transport system substrate-binding protein
MAGHVRGLSTGLGLMLLATIAVMPTRIQAEAVTDSAGRAVRVDAPVRRVFAAGPPAAILLYTLAPETLLGWTRPLPEQAGRFMPSRYHDLPVVGRLTGRGGSANVETVLAAHPDLILDYGAVNPTFISLADRVQEQLGVPYLLLDGSLEQLPAAYRRLGPLLGRAERGERLARYAEELLADMQALRDKVPITDRPRVYYARGPDGLDTALPGAINVELLELVGARNVADVPGRGVVSVSLEQVLAWDPDLILTIDHNFRNEVETAPGWSDLRAVRAGAVYLAPELPFPWFDRPPSSNRLIGARWLAHLLYPAQVSDDLRAQVRAFYALFYQHELSDADLDALLDAESR